jgi:O-antigen ligase/Flp pilus assembly protein TadD
LFPASVRTKAAESTVLTAVLLTPLIFFLPTRDQFELPKLVFLGVLAAFLLLLPLPTRLPRKDPLRSALLGLFLLQTASSLPFTSLSWRVSFLGDYENFAGWTTALLFLTWYLLLSRLPDRSLLEKALRFNSLAALLSALYAIGQRFGFDLVHWNPDSVSAAREFASLGNPNFLAAYLAMSVPLFLGSERTAQARTGGPLPFLLLLGAGTLLMVVSTGKGLALLGLPAAGFPRGWTMVLGLAFLCLSLARLVRDLSPPGKAVGLWILLFGAFSTGSRGGFLALVLGLAFWAFLRWKDGTLPSFPSLPKGRLLALSLPLAGALGVFGWPFLERLLRSLIHVGQSLEDSRLHIWRAAWGMVRTHPFLGTGLDTFKTAYTAHCGIEAGRLDGMFVSSRTAHNELLQVAATTGLLGLVAHLTLLAVIVHLSLRAWKVLPPGSRGLLAALLASGLAYQVQNLFSFGVAALNLLWILLLASVATLSRHGWVDPTPPSAGSPGVLGTSLRFLLAAFLLFFWARRLAADIAFAGAHSVSETLKRPEGLDPGSLRTLADLGIERNRRAVEWMPLEVKYRVYLGLAYEQRARLEGAQGKDWVLRALDCYERSIFMNPSNAYYWNNLGRVRTELARWDKGAAMSAATAFGQAADLAPVSPLFRLQSAFSLEGLGRLDEAEAAFRVAFELDQDFSAKFLAQTAVEEYDQGRKDRAFQRLARAIEGHPRGPEAPYVRGRLLLYEGRKREALADFRRVEALGPTPEGNPVVQDLDRYLEAAKN